MRGTHVEGRPGSNNIGINTVKIRVVKPLGDSVPFIYAPDCATTKIISSECFSDWRGREYDDFAPGEVTKTTPSGDRTA